MTRRLLRPSRAHRFYRGQPIDRLLSVRVVNALARMGVTTIPHLVDLGVDTVLAATPNLGERSRAELEAAIADSGLRPLSDPWRRRRV